MSSSYLRAAACIVAFAVAGGAASRARAANCTAHYEGDLVVRPETSGRTMVLDKPFAYIGADCARWEVPAGAVIDGASIPRILWTAVGGPFEGKYRDASVIHDWFCATRTRAWRDVDRMFFEAMLVSGVGRLKAQVMYVAVYRGGPHWDELTMRNNRLAQHLTVAVLPGLHPTINLSTMASDAGGSKSGGAAPETPAVAPPPEGDVVTPIDQPILDRLSAAVGSRTLSLAQLDAIADQGDAPVP